MRIFATALSLIAIGLPAALCQDFNGTWKLKSARPEKGFLPEKPAAALEIETRDGRILCSGCAGNTGFTTNGQETKSRNGATSFSTIAKWEGSALLVNTIVNAPSGGYTQMDRWRISRDGTTLTIGREIVGRSGNAEASLVYEKQVLRPQPGATASGPGPKTPGSSLEEYAVEAGTAIPLTVINSVSTKQSVEGDRVYLVTAFPVVRNGRVVIAPGSYVAGTLTQVKRPGRMKGRGELYLRFDSLTLPNGVTREFRARVGALDGTANGRLDREEGKIEGEGNKAGDARSVGEAAATGASVGAIAGSVAGRTGLGLGVGAAAGAAAGVMGVLLTRGPDILLTRGTTLEMVLDRRLSFTRAELDGSSGGQVR